MNIFETKSKILLTCPKRISPFLRMEVEALGLPVIKEGYMGVESEGSFADCMKLNMYSRTAHRVLYLLKNFKASNADDLYDQISLLEWEKYIPEDGYFSVISFTDNDTIVDTRFASLRCKDAIADRMMKKFNMRPDSGPDRYKTVINLHWKEKDVSVYIDTSGETIAKHGYRKIPLKAPMQETLAAAIILASNWDRKSTFINPMCGSGTIAIEAAMIAQNRPPGLLRSNYGFMHVKGYDNAAWEVIRWEAKQGVKKVLEAKIIASDISEEAIKASINNAQTAGVDHLIEFKVCDFKETDIPEEAGVVFLNPEYGERLGDESELENTYKEIGDFFKQKCKGYTGYIFTGNMNLAKKIGLKAKRRIEFYNGTIDCRLLMYELYEGTRKIKDPEEGESKNQM
jgi:23S rRNA G2445 N2-methylase RlmL